jgi:AAA domain
MTYCPTCGCDPCVNPDFCRACSRAGETTMRTATIEQIFREVQSERGKTPPELLSVRASDLDMCGVEWLWPGRFALGKIGLIAGLPDMGKGQIACFIAAAVTAEIPFPCDEGNAPQGNVIWFNAEDDARDTIVPRLVAAGADLSRIHFVNGVRDDGGDKMFSLVTNLSLLRKKIEEIGSVVLVVIDPVSAYLGVGKVDGRSATDVRGVLSPLKDMAEELHIAVIGIAHFNKKDDIKSALLRVSDSIAYVAAARHVYAVLDDPEDKNSKLFVKAKNTTWRGTPRRCATAWASRTWAATPSSAWTSLRHSSSGTRSTSRSRRMRPWRLLAAAIPPPLAGRTRTCAAGFQPPEFASPSAQARPWRAPAAAR